MQNCFKNMNEKDIQNTLFITYKRLYSSINSLKNDILSIIEGIKGIDILEELYKENFFNYIKFYNHNNININLNV